MKKLIFLILMICVSYANTMRAENTDLSEIDNVIYAASQEAVPGSTITLSICMKNTASIRGFQFDLYLPESITAVKNNKGRYVSSLNNARLEEYDEHTLTISEQEDGCIRFLCGSQYDENFTGNDGEILTLSVQISEGIADGNYPVVLKNVKLTETDISKYYETESVESTLHITSTITSITAANQEKEGNQCYNLQGQRVETPRKGINIINHKKVMVR